MRPIDASLDGESADAVNLVTVSDEWGPSRLAGQEREIARIIARHGVLVIFED